MSFTLQPVTSNEIDSDALYLDEITLTSEQDAVLRYGQVEVPLRREPTLSAQHGAFQSINPTPRNSRGNCWKKRVMKWANWPIWCGERTDGNGHFPPFAALLAKRAIRSASCSLCAFLCTAQQSVAAGSEWTGMQVK
ncbi:putative large extracellular alpha-helical protein [Escherichia coli]|uniref:Putative large extracellular alpha-helical protein n=1 Tax=Escherichia coli TaxID=562 RepID=A0A376TCR1_ECOLX|nr:putative large extracellular alpha-helical protein [Escherichia coli]